MAAISVFSLYYPPRVTVTSNRLTTVRTESECSNVWPISTVRTAFKTNQKSETLCYSGSKTTRNNVPQRSKGLVSRLTGPETHVYIALQGSLRLLYGRPYQNLIGRRNSARERLNLDTFHYYRSVFNGFITK